jgi:hypothetical protein
MHDISWVIAANVVEYQIGKRWNERLKFFLGQSELTSGNMNHPMIGLNQDFSGQTSAPLTGIRGDFNAGVGKTRNEFANVHIHPARITNPWLGQRRGVEREHGYASHQLWKLSLIFNLCLNEPSTTASVL